MSLAYLNVFSFPQKTTPRISPCDYFMSNQVATPIIIHMILSMKFL